MRFFLEHSPSPLLPSPSMAPQVNAGCPAARFRAWLGQANTEPGAQVTEGSSGQDLRALSSDLRGKVWAWIFAPVLKMSCAWSLFFQGGGTD